MGSLSLKVLASVILFSSHVTALKCYQCQDVYTESGDSDASCRNLPSEAEPTQCIPSSTTGEEPTASLVPRCVKQIGAITAQENKTTYNVGDVIRSCTWVNSEYENGCKTGDPLIEVSEGDSYNSFLVDVYVWCVCRGDGCNIAGALRPAIWWLAAALIVPLLH